MARLTKSDLSFEYDFEYAFVLFQPVVCVCVCVIIGESDMKEGGKGGTQRKGGGGGGESEGDCQHFQTFVVLPESVTVFCTG